MFTRITPPKSVALVSLLCVAATGCLDTTESPLEPQFTVVEHQTALPNAFSVYTQNVYLGGDTGPLFSLDFSNIPAVLNATNVFWGQVQASAAPERAAAFVDEIDENRPHVVALQEVLRFVLLDGSFQPTGGLDLLALIEQEISARGLPYETSVVQEATSSTLPLGFDPATGGISQWLNFTDRIVIIRRTDVDIIDQAQGLYSASLPLGPIELFRGWARLTVDFEGAPHHLIATHLETQATGPIQQAQADELLNVVAAGLEGTVLVAGDLNSDAAASQGAPSWTPTYDNLIAAGFIDIWDRAPRGRPAGGVTCCQNPDLASPTALDQRIDFVLVRPSEESGPGSNEGDDRGLHRGDYRADIVGEARSDRTASGLWPSDHAGLIASLRLIPRRR